MARPKKNAGSGSTANQKFDLDNYLSTQDLDVNPEDKELSWIPLSKPWHDAIKLPGFARGYVSLVRGFSNTGKSTAFYEAIAGAQKVGDFPIVIETEGNWNDEHARNVGVKYKEVVDEETGEVTYKGDGFMLIKQHTLYEMYKNYDHEASKMMSKPTRYEPVIEDVALLINQKLKEQEEGKLPMNLCFLWDSIGTLNGYKTATKDASNNQWNAGSMNAFGSIVNFKIPSSRDKGSKYTNTLICVQKIWLDNMNGGVIKHKGGEFMFFNSRLIVHLGGIVSHGTTKLNATALGNTYQYGTRTKIKCEKNHISGIEKSGMIASTPHGFVNPDEVEEYKKANRAFIHAAMNVPFDANVTYTEEEDLGDTSEVDF